MFNVLKVPVKKYLGPKSPIPQKWVSMRMLRSDARYRRRCSKCKKFIAKQRRSAYCPCCQSWRMKDRREKAKIKAMLRKGPTAYEVLKAAGF